MIKIQKISIATLVLFSSAPLLADTSYSNSRTTITIGDDYSYFGCSKKNDKCLEINQVYSVEDGDQRYEWRNNRYRYVLKALNKKRTRYRFRVYTPSKRKIKNEILSIDK